MPELELYANNQKIVEFRDFWSEGKKNDKKIIGLETREAYMMTVECYMLSCFCGNTELQGKEEIATKHATSSQEGLRTNFLSDRNFAVGQRIRQTILLCDS